jgi:oligoendopeptidase F
MSNTQEHTSLPRWSVADVHESFDARSFTDAMEAAGAGVARLEALFDELDVRAQDKRNATNTDAEAADKVIVAFNQAVEAQELLGAYIYATVSTDTRNEQAQGLLSEMETLDARVSP